MKSRNVVKFNSNISNKIIHHLYFDVPTYKKKHIILSKALKLL